MAGRVTGWADGGAQRNGWLGEWLGDGGVAK